MLLIILFIALILFGIVCLAYYVFSGHDFLDSIFPIICFVILIGANIVSLGIAGEQYIKAEAEYQSSLQCYNSLVYQLENDFYNNDNEVGKKQLMDDIAYYNQTVIYYQTLTHDFWIGIYLPDWYDDLPLIEIEGVK